MILGIGTDLVHISRIKSVLDRQGDCFARRILDPDEFAIFQGYSAENQRTSFLAKRFAAKEALSKALKTGIGKVSWQHINVSNDALGAPEINLSDEALRVYREMGATSVQLSLSDERDLALAFVVLSR